MSKHESDLHQRASIYRAQLQQAVNSTPFFDDEDDYNIDNLVQWFALWRDNTKRLLAIYK